MRVAQLAVLLTAAIISEVCAGITWAMISTLVVLMSLVLIEKYCDLFNLRRVTIFSFWYLTYLAMIFFPGFFVFADQEGPYRARFLFAVHTVLITVPVGCLLASWYWGFRKSETEHFFQAEMLPVLNTKRLKTAYFFLLVPSILLTIAYVRSVDTIPLFYLWKNPGAYMQIAALREDSFKLLDSPFAYAFYVLRSVMYPFLVILSLGVYLQTKQKLWRNLFVVTLIFSLFYCSLSVAKLPVAAIVALIGFLMYYYRGGRMGRKAVAVLSICMLVFPLGVILVAYEGINTVGTAFYGMSTRLLYVPAEMVYYYFEVFPSHQDYLLGRSSDKFARLTGRVPFDTPNYVAAYMGFPGGLDTQSANGAFIADLNADFGMTGVLFGGLAAGWIMQWFHVHAVRRRKTVSVTVLYAFLTFTFWILNSTSLPIVLVSNGAILILFISWWLEKPTRSTNAGGTTTIPRGLSPVRATPVD